MSLEATLPANFERYKVVGPFTEATIPAGLLRRHTLKAGVWGRIVVLRGRLRYVRELDPDVCVEVTQEGPAIVLPEEPHRIEADGSVSFEVEFWRELP